MDSGEKKASSETKKKSYSYKVTVQWLNQCSYHTVMLWLNGVKLQHWKAFAKLAE